VALRLRPLREDELPELIERGRRSYADNLVSQAGASREGAAHKARNDWERFFPGGNLQPDNEVFAVVGSDNERVGDLWLAFRENDFGERVAFLYWIEIAPEFRGQGLGRETMLLFEREVRARGLSEANLMVFGGNDVARSLYGSLGYTERAVFMSKSV